MIAGLYFEEHGPTDAPPVILSSGLGGTGDYWRHNLAALAEDHRVILYDHRGTGRSDRLLPAHLTVEDMADDLRRLIEGLAIGAATIVGHAAGGLVGLALALRAPAMVSRLTIVNGWSRADPAFIRCFEVRLALLRDSGAEAYLLAQPIFLHPSQWISTHDRRLRAEMPGQLRHFQGEENLNARVDALRRFDVDSRLGEILAPTLVIAAEDDILVPASCAERLAEGIPGATLARMTGGHACNVTDPIRFNHTLLAWLAGAPTEGDR